MPKIGIDNVLNESRWMLYRDFLHTNHLYKSISYSIIYMINMLINIHITIISLINKNDSYMILFTCIVYTLNSFVLVHTSYKNTHILTIQNFKAKISGLKQQNNKTLVQMI